MARLVVSAQPESSQGFKQYKMANAAFLMPVVCDNSFFACESRLRPACSCDCVDVFGWELLSQ